jgi:MYXO-CTERM domain-containing protein
MTTFRRALATASTLALAGCLLEGEEPLEQPPESLVQTLIGGELTNGEEDFAVVALTAPGVSASQRCTGTLVSPRVILTAAHCIDTLGANPALTIVFGNDVQSPTLQVGVDMKAQHPMWTGNVGRFDIGMLRLRAPMDPELPMRMNDTPATEHLGEVYRHVGFGAFDRDPVVSDGKKRQGETTITGFNSDVIFSGDEELAICFGDSGGPGILTIGDEEVVAGVHSFTQSSQCLPPGGDTRVDLYLDDFILPWIQMVDTTCHQDGLCARIGCIDDPDCLPCGADGTCTEGCELPDPDCPTSDIGEICQANSQCMTGTCIFWKNDADFRFCTRECNPAADDCPSGMSCQNRAGFGDVCYFDDDPPGILGDSCESALDCGTYTCEEGVCVKRCNLAIGLTCPTGFDCQTRDDGQGFFCYSNRPIDDGSGGCSCSLAEGGGNLAWLLVPALALLWRRRRRSR